MSALIASAHSRPGLVEDLRDLRAVSLCAGVLMSAHRPRIANGRSARSGSLDIQIFHVDEHKILRTRCTA